MGWILLTTTSEDSLKKKASRGFSFAPKVGAGVSWKNRRALAERKAANVIEKGIGVGNYLVNYQAVEKGVKGVPVFERAAAAKKKEEVRQGKNVNLAIRRAQDILGEREVWP